VSPSITAGASGCCKTRADAEADLEQQQPGSRLRVTAIHARKWLTRIVKPAPSRYRIRAFGRCTAGL